MGADEPLTHRACLLPVRRREAGHRVDHGDDRRVDGRHRRWNAWCCLDARRVVLRPEKAQGVARREGCGAEEGVLKTLLNDPRFPEGRRLETLQIVTGTSSEECRRVLIEVEARGVILGGRDERKPGLLSRTSPLTPSDHERRAELDRPPPDPRFRLLLRLSDDDAWSVKLGPASFRTAPHLRDRSRAAPPSVRTS